MKKIVALILFTVVFLVFAINCKNSRDAINVGSIIANYQKSKFLGNLKFKNRNLKITGKILSIDPYNQLNDPNAPKDFFLVKISENMDSFLMGNAVCNFKAKDGKEILNYKPGDQIIISAKVVGFIGDLILDNCIFLSGQKVKEKK